jgi:hypothetical protein
VERVFHPGLSLSKGSGKGGILHCPAALRSSIAVRLARSLAHVFADESSPTDATLPGQRLTQADELLPELVMPELPGTALRAAMAGLIRPQRVVTVKPLAGAHGESFGVLAENRKTPVPGS